MLPRAVQDKVQAQVDVDVKRCFHHAGLQDAERASLRASLRSVLLAFSLHSKTGYVQGMDSVAGIALLPDDAAHSGGEVGEADEEASFWWLDHVVHTMLSDFFSEVLLAKSWPVILQPPLTACAAECTQGMRGLLVEQRCLAEALDETRPDFAKHLAAIDISATAHACAGDVA